MRTIFLTAVLGGAALLGACDVNVHNDQEAAASGNAQVSAEGKAEEGRIAMKGPGFDFALNVPDFARGTSIDNDNKLLYPGSSISGMFIAAGEEGQKGRESEVELRFASADAPDKVAAWYRDPARAEGFTLASSGQQGQGFAFAGTTKEGDGFKLQLSPKGGGGTDGRITIRDSK